MNPSATQTLTVEAQMFDRGGTETRTVRRVVAPAKGWEFNLSEFWLRPGRNVNVGIRLICDGACPGYVASYFAPLTSGVSATIYPILRDCP